MPKLIENPGEYLPRLELLEILCPEFDTSRVFYFGIVKDIIKSTRLYRILEGGLLILAICLILMPIMIYLDTGGIEKDALFFLAFVLLPLAFHQILRQFRGEELVDNFLVRSSDPECAKAITDYFNNLRKSDLPLGKYTATGLQSAGKLHAADGGFLTLLGFPMERSGIRRFNMGWGKLYFPAPKLLAPELPTETIIKQKVIGLGLHIRSTSDLLALLKGGHAGLFDEIERVSLNRVADADRDKKSSYARTFWILRHSFENNISNPHEELFCKGLSGEKLSVSAETYRKVTSGNLKASNDRIRWLSGG